MKHSEWAQPIDAEQAAKRAGGRRHYNVVRRLAVQRRRGELRELGVLRPGAAWTLAELAIQFGVSRATICRDRQNLHAQQRADEAARLAGEEALRELIEQANQPNATLRDLLAALDTGLDALLWRYAEGSAWR